MIKYLNERNDNCFFFMFMEQKLEQRGNVIHGY